MAFGIPLGDFEQALMQAVRALKAEAFGATLHKHLVRHYRADLAMPQVHSTLARLQTKGYLDSEVEETRRPHKGGRRRRLFWITLEGSVALRETTAARRAALGRAA
jgi:PadR family transcriptional regulator PadR